MKTRLLKKLRKKAKEKFFPVLLEDGMIISTYSESGYHRLNLTYSITGKPYAWVNQFSPCQVYDTQESIQKTLNRIRRDFIIEYVKIEKEKRRLKNEFNKIK